MLRIRVTAWRLASFWLALMGMLVACGGEPTPLPSPAALSAQSTGTASSSPTSVATPLAPTASSATETPQSRDSIMLGAIGDPQRPRQVTTLPDLVKEAIYDSLLRVDQNDGSLQPGLADSWQVSDDARSLSFHLRSGVRWHDGQRLTAQDVVYTIKTLSDPALHITPATYFGSISDVNASDPQTVTLVLQNPDCAALTYLGTLKILPEHVLKNADLADLKSQDLIGSGPLVLKQWNADAIVLTRNADYWNGAPAIRDWTLKLYPKSRDAQAALEGGQIDLLSAETAPPASADDSSGLKVYSRAQNQFYALALNNSREPFDDARVRQAIGAAIDRGRLARTQYSTGTQVLETSTLPDFWAHPDQINQVPYDPARARQLLSDAGWRDSDGDGVLEKNGRMLRVKLWSEADDPVLEPLAFSVRDMLSQIGVQALLQLDDRGGFLTRVFTHEYDLALTRWNIPLDPDQYVFWGSDQNDKGAGFNVTSYSNPQVDDLFKRANGAARCDPVLRSQLYAEAYQTMAADVPEIFIFAPPAFMIARSNVRGLAPSSYAGDYWNLSSWQVLP